MKPRVLKTYKILAVALVATGCAPSVPASSGPAPEPIRSESAPVAAAPVEASVAATSAPSPAPPPPVAIAAPLPVKATDPVLLALRDQLIGSDRAGVMTQRDHFRPLCDADGYPLVGNMIRKGGPDYQPSQFCAEVRGTPAR